MEMPPGVTPCSTLDARLGNPWGEIRRIPDNLEAPGVHATVKMMLEHLPTSAMDQIRRNPICIVDGKVTRIGLILAGGWLRDYHPHASKAITRGRDIDLFVVADSEQEAEAWATEHFGFGTIKTTNAFSIMRPNAIVTDLSDEIDKIQIIWRRARKTPEDVIRGFDFTCCKAAIWCEAIGGDVQVVGVFHRYFEERVATARLTFEPGPDAHDTAASSFIRALKFLRRGWETEPGDIMLMMQRRLEELNEQAASAANVEKPGHNATQEHTEPSMGVLGDMFEGMELAASDFVEKIESPVTARTYLALFFRRPDGSFVTGDSSGEGEATAAGETLAYMPEKDTKTPDAF